MMTRMGGRQRRGRFVPHWLLLAFLAFLVACGSGNPAEGFGTPVPGQRVYDRSGTLAPDQLRALEDQAAAVTAAGAPTIVYIRARDADNDETQEHARDLLAAWGIESAPGARDGLVIFLNLDPDDTRHGAVALFAGQRHFDGGNLPERELQRIFDDEMRPLLADGQIAAGIGAGLAASARSLTFGPPPAPPPSALQRTAGQFARLPLNALAIAAAIGSALLAIRAWRTRPTPATPGAPTQTRPGNLAPALAGALVARGIHGLQLAEATLLDLARRGALVVEPADQHSARIRPLNASVLAAEHERQLWSALAAATDGEGTVSSKELGKAMVKLGDFQEAIRADLVARGWYDPTAKARRSPLYSAALAALLGGILALILAAIGREFWGLPAAGFFLASSIALFSFAYALPETTAAGERAAAPWHAYRAGLEQAGRDQQRPLDLDTALPDAAALGVTSKLDKRLKDASNNGYAPAWFVRNDSSDGGAAFYPIWLVLHNSSTSSSSSSSSTAATGGGGAGGSF